MPAESKGIIFLFSSFVKSGYFKLKPSVLIVVDEGKSKLDNLFNKKDFPLFPFPTTPILIHSFPSFFLYNWFPISEKRIFQPFSIFFIEFIPTIIS